MNHLGRWTIIGLLSTMKDVNNIEASASISLITCVKTAEDTSSKKLAKHTIKPHANAGEHVSRVATRERSCCENEQEQ